MAAGSVDARGPEADDDGAAAAAGLGGALPPIKRPSRSLALPPRGLSKGEVMGGEVGIGPGDDDPLRSDNSVAESLLVVVVGACSVSASPCVGREEGEFDGRGCENVLNSCSSGFRCAVESRSSAFDPFDALLVGWPWLAES